MLRLCLLAATLRWAGNSTARELAYLYLPQPAYPATPPAHNLALIQPHSWRSSLACGVGKGAHTVEPRKEGLTQGFSIAATTASPGNAPSGQLRHARPAEPPPRQQTRGPRSSLREVSAPPPPPFGRLGESVSAFSATASRPWLNMIGQGRGKQRSVMRKIAQVPPIWGAGGPALPSPVSPVVPATTRPRECKSTTKQNAQINLTRPILASKKVK